MKKGLSRFFIALLSTCLFFSCTSPLETNSSAEYSGARSVSTSNNSYGVYITEVSDSARYQSEFVEIYNVYLFEMIE